VKRCLLGVTLLVVVGACGRGDGGVTSESTTATPTTEPPATSPLPPRLYDSSPTAAVIRVAEHRGALEPPDTVLPRAVVYGDGAVLRAADTPSGYERFVLRPGGVEALLAEATEYGLREPLDTGSPRISDHRSLVVELALEADNHVLQVYAPGYDEGLTRDQVDARGRVEDFAATILGLPEQRPHLVADNGEPVPYQTERINLSARPGPLSGPVSRPWPLDRSITEVFSAECATVAGAETPAVLAMLDGDRDQGVVLVATDQPAVPVLEITVTVARPDEPPCDTNTRSPGRPDDPPPERWPADDRREADIWAVWAGQHAVAALAEQGQLGIDAGIDPDNWLEYHYGVATVDGTEVVDVEAQLGLADDAPNWFAVRVSLATGEVLELVLG